MLNKKLDQLIEDLKKEIGLLLSISFGIFLFVLFFQPFSLNKFDLNNNLIFVAGLGAIVFTIITLIRITVPGLFRKNINGQTGKKLFLPAYFNGFMILLLNTLAFVFYLRYVGSVSINFFIVIKIILLCLTPPVILAVYDYIDDLRHQNELLLTEAGRNQKQIAQFQEDMLNKSIEFISENNSEVFSLLISEVVFIRSADNYVEIVYKEGSNFKKTLIRNTLKNIEIQLKQYSIFVRCHRICIVNLQHVDKIVRSNGNHWIVIKEFHEQLPVSRQYLIRLKEALS